MAKIVKELLDFLGDSIKIVYYVFDGALRNVTMATMLRANLSLQNLEPYLFHPITNSKNFIIFDAVRDPKLQTKVVYWTTVVRPYWTTVVCKMELHYSPRKKSS